VLLLLQTHLPLLLLPQLEPLCRYLTHVASTLYRGSLAASDLERRSLK
jgi:hypothetical protein